MVGCRDKSTNARVRNIPGAEQDWDFRKSGWSASTEDEHDYLILR